MKKYENLLPYLVILIVFIWHSFSLTSYPMYFPDDGMTGSRIHGIIKNGTTNGPLESRFLDLIPGGERSYGSLTYYIRSIPIRIFNINNLFTNRILNLLLILSILILTYKIAYEIEGKNLGLLSVVFLGFSKLFAYSTHICRPDIFATNFCLISIYLIISNKKNAPIKDILSALFLIFAFESHPRAVVLFPIIGIIYIHKYRQDVFRIKNSYLFAFSLIVFGLIYKIIFLAPYSEAIAKYNSIIVGNSRSLPILSLDFFGILNTFNEITKLLYADNLIYLVVYLECFLLFTKYKKTQIGLIIITGIISTVCIMRNFYEFNSIILLPIIFIGVSAFCLRITKIKNGYYILSAIIIATTFSNLNKMYNVTAKSCNEELEENFFEINKFVTAKDKIIGVDSFWFFLQKNDFSSWTIIKYLMKYFNFSLEEAMMYLKPDFLIFDGNLLYFLNSSENNSDWYNGFRLDKEEFYTFVNTFGTLVYEKPNTCRGPLRVYKFNF